MISLVLVDWLNNSYVCILFTFICCVNFRNKKKIRWFYSHWKRKSNLLWCSVSSGCFICFIFIILYFIQSHNRHCVTQKTTKELLHKLFDEKKELINKLHRNIDKWWPRDCFSSSDNVICFGTIWSMHVCLCVSMNTSATKCVCSECSTTQTTTPTTTRKTNNQFRSIGFDTNTATVAVAEKKLQANKCIVECGQVDVALWHLCHGINWILTLYT